MALLRVLTLRNPTTFPGITTICVRIWSVIVSNTTTTATRPLGKT